MIPDNEINIDVTAGADFSFSKVAKIIPTKPQSHPQRESIIKMTKGEMPRLFPYTRGSTMFPSVMLIAMVDANMKMIGTGLG